MLERIRVSTERKQELHVITDRVNDVVRRSGVGEGLCHVFVPHTTAGVTINENADPDVGADLLEWLDVAAPQNGRYRHREGNAHAHIKASIIGQSVTVPVQAARLALGTWQGVFLAEFDGPRERTVVVTVMAA